MITSDLQKNSLPSDEMPNGGLLHYSGRNRYKAMLITERKDKGKCFCSKVSKEYKNPKKDSEKGLTNGGRFGNIVKRLAGDRERGAS